MLYCDRVVLPTFKHFVSDTDVNLIIKRRGKCYQQMLHTGEGWGRRTFLDKVCTSCNLFYLHGNTFRVQI